jgi:hypothetical protein
VCSFLGLGVGGLLGAVGEGRCFFLGGLFWRFGVFVFVQQDTVWEVGGGVLCTVCAWASGPRYWTGLNVPGRWIL